MYNLIKLFLLFKNCSSKSYLSNGFLAPSHNVFDLIICKQSIKWPLHILKRPLIVEFILAASKYQNVTSRRVFIVEIDGLFGGCCFFAQTWISSLFPVYLQQGTWTWQRENAHRADAVPLSNQSGNQKQSSR